VWLLGTYPIGWIYSVVLHGLYGQTLGKMAMGIKVIDVGEERPMTIWQAFLRESVFIFFNTIFLCYSIYFVLNDVPRDGSELAHIDTVVLVLAYVWFFAEIGSCLTNYKRRAIHDFIAGTVVVNVDRS
jgi:uncharacterized RDD family membrane protein YckC